MRYWGKNTVEIGASNITLILIEPLILNLAAVGS
jgi:hypothetical protein